MMSEETRDYIIFQQTIYRPIYISQRGCTIPRPMMTSLNGNIFRVTGPLCGEFTGPGEFTAQRPVTRGFDVFFYLRLNKRLSKQPQGWWFETPSWSLWRQCNALQDFNLRGAVASKNSSIFWLDWKENTSHEPVLSRCLYTKPSENFYIPIRPVVIIVVKKRYLNRVTITRPRHLGNNHQNNTLRGAYAVRYFRAYSLFINQFDICSYLPA